MLQPGGRPARPSGHRALPRRRRAVSVCSRRRFFFGPAPIIWRCRGPIQVLNDGPSDGLGDLWHAEGGRYERTLGDGVTWVRRRQAWRERDGDERRPADQFDPKAATRFEGLGNGLSFELGAEAPPLALRPFIARLVHLTACPPNPLLRPPKEPDIEVSEGRPLTAWFQPRAERLTMSWQVSPPLSY